MILELPLSSDPAQSFVTQLGDVKYRFEIRFNDRSNVWTLDMLDEITQEPLLYSIPIVLGLDLLEAYNFGIGRLFAVDESNRGKDATESDLGSRVKVYWFSPDEVLP